MWLTWLWEASAPSSGQLGTACMGQLPGTSSHSISQRYEYMLLCGACDIFNIMRDIVAIIYQLVS